MTFYLFLIIFSRLFLGCLSTTCPDACICKWKGGKQTVECTEKSLITLPDKIDPETQALDMSGNNLQVLPNATFKRASLLDLQKVHLRNCRLGQIDEKALVGLSNLVELDLSLNLLTSVPSAVFEDVPNLRYLSLAQNPIQKIEGHAFRMVPGLIKLDLSQCQVQTISSNAFDGIEFLEFLKINGNRLRDLKPKTIEMLTELHGVELHENPWNCDCKIRTLKLWLMTKNIPYPIEPICAEPKRLLNRAFSTLSSDEFACRPEIKPDNRYVEAETGENATIICRVESRPTAKINWYFNGKLLTNSTSYTGPYQRVIIVETISDIDKRSSLTVTNAKESDWGQFFCVAENAAGTSEANFTLRVSESIVRFALFVNGPVAGIGAGLVFVLFSILIVVTYWIFHEKKLIRNNVEAGPSNKAGNPARSGSSGDAGGRRRDENNINDFPTIREVNVPATRRIVQPISYVSYKGETTESGPHTTSNPDLLANVDADGSDPLFYTNPSSWYQQSTSHSSTNRGSSVSRQYDNYTVQEYGIDSNDRTPIMEEVPPFFGQPVDFHSNRRILHTVLEDNSTSPESFTNDMTFGDMAYATNATPFGDNKTNPFGNHQPPNAKTLRVWQKGIQVLPTVHGTRCGSSPDEGFQEGCGTDV